MFSTPPAAPFGGFVAAFIPAIGTYLGSAVPIIMTLAIQGLVPALIVLGYALIYQQIENYWLSPRISSDTMTLNGAVAFGAALAGGAIARPMGAFVALPVAALTTAFVSDFVPKNEVAYEFKYEQHVDAAGESTGERSATDDEPNREPPGLPPRPHRLSSARVLNRKERGRAAPSTLGGATSRWLGTTQATALYAYKRREEMS